MFWYIDLSLIRSIWINENDSSINRRYTFFVMITTLRLFFVVFPLGIIYISWFRIRFEFSRINLCNLVCYKYVLIIRRRNTIFIRCFFSFNIFYQYEPPIFWLTFIFSSCSLLNKLFFFNLRRVFGFLQNRTNRRMILT